MAIDGLDWLYRQMELVGLESLQEAAEACGLDKAALWRYFNGDVRPSIDRLPNLCRGLQVSLDQLRIALKVHIKSLQTRYIDVSSSSDHGLHRKILD